MEDTESGTQNRILRRHGADVHWIEAREGHRLVMVVGFGSIVGADCHSRTDFSDHVHGMVGQRLSPIRMGQTQVG